VNGARIAHIQNPTFREFPNIGLGLAHVASHIATILRNIERIEFFDDGSKVVDSILCVDPNTGKDISVSEGHADADLVGCIVS
jgi:hypothetical protein